MVFSFLRVYQTEPELFKWFEFLNQDDIEVEKLNEQEVKLFGNGKSATLKPSMFESFEKDQILFKRINEFETQLTHCITLLKNSILFFKKSLI